jgi:hypothetical protein
VELVDGQYDVVIPGEEQQNSNSVAKRVKSLLLNRIADAWQAAPKQGHTAATFRNRAANAWMHTSDLSPTTYCWALKARTDTLPTMANLQRWKKSHDPSCKHCNDLETLHHVLTACNHYSALRTERHNHVLGRLAAAARHRPNVQVHVNVQPPMLVSTLRPDLVLVNETDKKIAIVDVAITAQVGADCLTAKRQQKVDKYAHLADEYRAKGYDVELDAVVFGDVGGTDGHNEQVMIKMIGARPRYARLMHRFCIAGVLRHGRSIWSMRSN